MERSPDAEETFTMTFRESAGRLACPIAILSLVIGAAVFSGCTAQTGAVPPSREAVKESLRRQEEAVAKSKGRAGRSQPKYKSIKSKILDSSQPD
jgi:hypothetical protein